MDFLCKVTNVYVLLSNVGRKIIVLNAERKFETNCGYKFGSIYDVNTVELLVHNVLGTTIASCVNGVNEELDYTEHFSNNGSIHISEIDNAFPLMDYVFCT